jgi:hypothetical protein
MDRGRVSQLLDYLRYRRQLIRLNRDLSGMTVVRDLVLVRTLTIASSDIKTVPTLILKAIGLGEVGVIAAVALLVIRSHSKLWILMAVGGLFAIELAWLLVRIGVIPTSYRLSSINLAMSEGARDLRRARRLAAVWDRGRYNTAGLQLLYRLHEPQRAELRRAGLDFEPIMSRADSDRGTPAGAWRLPLAPLLTELMTDLEPTDEGYVSTWAQRDKLEDDLPPFAARERADARTRLLAQWRVLRTERPDGGTKEALTEQALADKADAAEAGLNHVIHAIRLEGGRPRIVVNRAGYGQIMRSSDYLIEEAIIALGVCAEAKVQLGAGWLKRALPGRRWVLDAGADELIAAPRRRAVGVGLAAVVVTRRHGNLELLYKRRSHAVGTYPDMYHAVPTGMYNSKIRDMGRQEQRIHPGRVLLTEFLEELKDVKSLEGFEPNEALVSLLGTHLSWLTRDPVGYDHFLRKRHGDVATAGEAADALRAAHITSDKHALDDIRIHVTGLALDLLSLRPEVCCVIEVPADCVVDPDAEAHEEGSAIKLNEEGANFFRLPGKGAATAINELANPCDWVRSGYAAMVLANETYADPAFTLDAQNSCEPADFGLAALRSTRPG